MRIAGFLCLVVLCQVYGLAFDWVADGGLGNILCALQGAQDCVAPTRNDNLLAAFTLLLLAPTVIVCVHDWFSNRLRFARATALVSLLLVTA
jgi:hypothetical protein